MQVLEAGLGGFELHRVEPITGLERHLAADHLVLGLGVAGDVHLAHAVARAFRDAVNDGHSVGAGIADVGRNSGIGVTTGSVVAADHRDVVTHLLRVVGIVAVEGECRVELLRLEDSHLAETHTGDRVFLALADRDHDVHAAVLDRLTADARAADAQVALAAVEIEDGIEVLLELVGLDASGLGEPGQPALGLGLHLLAQFVGGEGGVAFEADLADLILGSLIDHENQVRHALAVGGLNAMGHAHIRIAVSTVVFLKVAAGFENLGITHHAARLELGFLGEFLIGKHRVAHESHSPAHRAGGHLGDEFHAFAYRLGQETHVVHQAGFIE